MVPSTLHASIKAHSGPISTVTYNSSGQYVLTASHDKLVKLFNPSSGLLVKTYSGHGYEVLDVKLAKGDEKFVSGSGDKAVFLWDVSSGKTIRRWTGHWQRVNCVAVNFDSSLVLSGSYDATVKLWDARSQNRQAVQTLSDAKDSVSSLSILDSTIITTSVDGVVRMYDVRVGSIVSDELGVPITHATLSNDANCLLVSSLDDRIRLLDRESGQVLASYKGHRNRDYRIVSTLSNDDAYVVSGSEDGRIVVWDLVECGVVEDWIAHQRATMCTAYHPTEHQISSGGGDGVLNIWRTPII